MEETNETNKRKLIENVNGSCKKANLECKEKCTYPVLSPIVSNKYLEPITTEIMFIGKVNLKKETSRLIKELSSTFPLGGMSHLKRVRWTDEKDIFEIIIRPLHSSEVVDMNKSYALRDILKNYNINTLGLMDEVVLLNIPKNPVFTYKQYKEASKYWPVQFREDKYIEKLLIDKLFTDIEKKNIQKYMEMCIDAAKHGDEKVGCVVVDPKSSKVIAVSHDLRFHHPLQHAIMVAADLVAKSQGGGSWNIESKHVQYSHDVQDEIDKNILEQKAKFPEKEISKLTLPYLCTSYDIYVSREPCVMCAMALVHSRIRRVFYLTKTSCGALGSHWKLHLQSGLNHHYEVFQVILDDENSPQNDA